MRGLEDIVAMNNKVALAQAEDRGFNEAVTKFVNMSREVYDEYLTARSECTTAKERAEIDAIYL